MHPGVIAIVVVDLAGAAAISVALLQSLRVSMGWLPSSASAEQLRLERYAQEASAAGRLGLVFHLVATVALIGVVNHLLPSLVPGAMCGTGVMQAMPQGWGMVAARGASITVLSIWIALDSLNRASPTGPITQQASRVMLVAGALTLAAIWQTASSLWGLNVHQAVSCCAAVYDLAAVAYKGEIHVAGALHAWLLAVLGAGLVAWSSVVGRRPGRSSALMGGALALAFVVMGGWVLTDWTAPVIYQTLGHRCPMCMFLPRHGAVGYLAFGLLGWIGLEASIAVAVLMVSRAAPETHRHAVARSRSSSRRVAIATVAFLAIALGIPIAWWLRFGVWLSGS